MGGPSAGIDRSKLDWKAWLGSAPYQPVSATGGAKILKGLKCPDTVCAAIAYDKFIFSYRGTPPNLRNWLDCIKGRKQPNSHIRAGVECARTSQLANTAPRQRKTIIP